MSIQEFRNYLFEEYKEKVKIIIESLNGEQLYYGFYTFELELSLSFGFIPNFKFCINNGSFYNIIDALLTIIYQLLK